MSWLHSWMQGSTSSLHFWCRLGSYTRISRVSCKADSVIAICHSLFVESCPNLGRMWAVFQVSTPALEFRIALEIMDLKRNLDPWGPGEGVKKDIDPCIYNEELDSSDTLGSHQFSTLNESDYPCFNALEESQRRLQRSKSFDRPQNQATGAKESCFPISLIIPNCRKFA